MAECRRAPGVEISYHLLFDIDPTHRGLLVYDVGYRTDRRRALRRAANLHARPTERPASQRRSCEFRGAGRSSHRHRLRPHCLPRASAAPCGARAPAGTVRPPRRAPTRSRIDILKVVTAFTLAHSLTLGLAASGVLVLPPSFVEATIAASIIVAALINLLPNLHAHAGGSRLRFGLVHGFGFANVLGELDLRGVALAVPLAGFNVGVELGQLLIAAAALPLLFLLRRRPVYRRWVLPGGSAADRPARELLAGRAAHRLRRRSAPASKGGRRSGSAAIGCCWRVAQDVRATATRRCRDPSPVSCVVNAASRRWVSSAGCRCAS